MLQHRYEIILSPNYFITVVYYYRTHSILFLYFFSIPTFLHFLNFFITGTITHTSTCTIFRSGHRCITFSHVFLLIRNNKFIVVTQLENQPAKDKLKNCSTSSKVISSSFISPTIINNKGYNYIKYNYQ